MRLGAAAGMAMEQDVNIQGFPQPLGFYRVLTGTDHLHFGYWPEGEKAIGLMEAQERLSALLFGLLPPAPARVLDVGCGLGATAGVLHTRGYEVVAIAPSPHLIEYARARHPGPTYLPCGFLDEDVALDRPERYDVILFQESLQYLPDLDAVFEKAGPLLAPGGRMIVGDEVSYSPNTLEQSAVHQASEIERSLAEAGFHVRRHHRIGPQVRRTCPEVLALFRDRRGDLIEIFGEASGDEIDRYIRGWETQQEWYSQGRFGYEVWDVRYDGLRVRPYRPGDETAILDMFRDVFRVERSLPHWRWEFLENPFGGPQVITVWDGGSLVSNYAAYPVPFWMDDHMTLINQGVDTMTRPSHRGVGRGPTSLLARAVRVFYRLHCEGKVAFYYGFNTGKIQKFGRMFLNYTVVAGVTEWVLEGPPLDALLSAGTWRRRIAGYSVRPASNAGGWADRFFQEVRGEYGRLAARDARYLTWRYLSHPGCDYVLMVVRRWGRVAGWWLGKVEGESLVIGDALFASLAALAPAAGLSGLLRHMKGRGIEIRQVRGWFSHHPSWWTDRLSALGFEPRPEPNGLGLCMNIFLEPLKPEEVADRMYFTQGDSDLF